MVAPKQRLLNFYEFRSSTLKNELDCKMGCMGCNLASEMAEHNEAIRTVLAQKGERVKSHISNVIEEAQNLGEMSSAIDARNLTEFIEDAGKGAMTTMKEMQSAYPIDNFMSMVKNVLLT